MCQLNLGENKFVTSDKEILKGCENVNGNLSSSHTDTDYIRNNKSPKNMERGKTRSSGGLPA